MPSRRKQPAKRSRTKLRAALAPAATEIPAPATVPTRWVKFIVALFLLPPLWVLTKTFFTAFARTTIHDTFWASEEFWFFGIGVLVWLVAFFGLPRPLWIYVFGHELTHVIWVWLHGGRVSAFRITPQGGHILADRINTWIALAPYFFPIYSLLVIAIYGLAGLFWDMTPFRPVLYMLIGATWAFHITFTVWMIPRGQSDLTYGGTFFSLVIILGLNIAILSGFLIAASPGVSLGGFSRDLFDNAAVFSSQAIALLQRLHL